MSLFMKEKHRKAFKSSSKVGKMSLQKMQQLRIMGEYSLLTQNEFHGVNV